MTLRVEVSIPIFSGGDFEIGTLRITRLEPLHDPSADYPYEAELVDRKTGATTSTTITHRYSDGAWVLISTALTALGHPANEGA
jgi:hypothetical protein